MAWYHIQECRMAEEIKNLKLLVLIYLHPLQIPIKSQGNLSATLPLLCWEPSSGSPHLLQKSPIWSTCTWAFKIYHWCVWKRGRRNTSTFYIFTQAKLLNIWIDSYMFHNFIFVVCWLYRCNFFPFWLGLQNLETSMTKLKLLSLLRPSLCIPQLLCTSATLLFTIASCNLQIPASPLLFSLSCAPGTTVLPCD